MATSLHRVLNAAAVAAGLLLPAEGAAASTAVSIEVRGAVPSSIVLTASPLGSAGADRAAMTISLPAGKFETLVDLPDKTRWRLEASAEGLWSAPVELSAQEQAAVRLTLWPAAEVTAQVRPPSGAAMPKELRLRLVERSVSSPPAASGAQPPEAEIVCPATEKGQIECLTPAGRWDLRAKAEGFVPLYFWNLALEPRGATALGGLHLRKGASVLGRVATDAGPADPAHAEVELRPVVYGGTDGAHGPQLRQLVFSSQVNAWGYFNFAGIPAGSYTLEARQPDFQPARVTPLAVREGEDLEIGEALVLHPARHLVISVDPPRDPRRKPWRLLLLAAEEGSVINAAEGATDRSGRWRSPPLPTGIYVVQVLDAGGNEFFWREVTLAEPSQKLVIELPLVEVVGTVRLGEEPLASRLFFGGKRGRGGIKIEAESDAEGQFSIVLPRGGTWTVDVEADDPPVNAAGLEVEVRRRRDVEIEIPDTAIRGTVVDDDGRPVSGAWVHLARFEPGLSSAVRTTARDGSFAIQGQLPGRCFVWARARTVAGEVSDTAEVLVVEGSETPPLHLVVEARRVLRGRVTSAGGAAVAGAQVFADTFPAAGSPTLPGSDQTAADLDGAFELKLPQKTSGARLVVMAPGYPFAVWRVRLGEETRVVTLRLGETQGALHLPRTDSNFVTPLFPLVLLDGEPVGGALLRSWALAGNGGSASGDLATVTAMPSGSYRYCELEPQEALLVLWGAAAPKESACAEGYLAPGGELTLRSPRATAAAKRQAAKP